MIIEFSTMFSKAIMCILNHDDEFYNINAKNKIVLKMNLKTKKLLYYYMKDAIKDNTFFGKKTVLVKSCKTRNNWRNTEIINDNTYNVNDDSIWIEPVNLELAIDEMWEKLHKELIPNVILLEVPSVDSCDIIQVLLQHRRLNYNNKQYTILTDNNNKYNTNNTKKIQSLISAALKKQHLI